MQFHPTLLQHIRTLESQAYEPDKDRREALDQITQFIQHQLSTFRKSELIFICTHNSRRSHFGQIWAKTLSDYYEIPTLETYSGGTAATAFNPNAIQALRTMGFQIEPQDKNDNPIYEVSYASDKSPIKAWSKVYADSANPSEGFCAIMTCSEADEACPMVLGAAQRVSLPYEDPKVADDTPQQDETYLERCHQIAQELMYALSKVRETEN